MSTYWTREEREAMREKTTPIRSVYYRPTNEEQRRILATVDALEKALEWCSRRDGTHARAAAHGRNLLRKLEGK